MEPERGNELLKNPEFIDCCKNEAIQNDETHKMNVQQTCESYERIYNRRQCVSTDVQGKYYFLL